MDFALNNQQWLICHETKLNPYPRQSIKIYKKNSASFQELETNNNKFDKPNKFDKLETNNNKFDKPMILHEENMFY